MTTKTTFTHTINCSADKLAQLFFDPAFNTNLYNQLGSPAFAVGNRTETDTQIICAFTGKRIGGYLPPPALQFVKNDPSYSENIVFNKTSQAGRSPITLSNSTSPALMFYDLSIVPVSDNQATRILTYMIEIKMFGIGGLQEQAFGKAFSEDADASAALINQLIAQGTV